MLFIHIHCIAFVRTINIFNVKLPFGQTLTQIYGCAGLTIGKKLVMDHYPECTRHVDTWIISESTGNLCIMEKLTKEYDIELYTY